MRVHTIAWLAPIAAALALVTTMPAGAEQSGSAIPLRSLLPRIEGETLSAKRMVLPEGVTGRVGFLVFSFSREAGDAARCWREAFTRIGAADTDATTYGIMMLGDVPWLVRGLAVAGIKRGIPAALHDRTVQVFADDGAWRTRLGVQSAGTPHLVLVDRAGKVRWLHAGACDGAGQQQLRDQVRIVVAEKTNHP